MLNGQKIIVVMPAHNAAARLCQTYNEVMAQSVANLGIVVDLTGVKLSEYHTDYRSFSRGFLQRLPLEKNSDDFVFAHQILAQILWLDCAIGDVIWPARYLLEASSTNFWSSVRYGFGCTFPAHEFAGQEFVALAACFP